MVPVWRSQQNLMALALSFMVRANQASITGLVWHVPFPPAETSCWPQPIYILEVRFQISQLLSSLNRKSQWRSLGSVMWKMRRSRQLTSQHSLDPLLKQPTPLAKSPKRLQVSPGGANQLIASVAQGNRQSSLRQSGKKVLPLSSSSSFPSSIFLLFPSFFN